MFTIGDQQLHSEKHGGRGPIVVFESGLGADPSACPLHLLIDSAGLQVYGAGQWLEAKHGVKSRRKWRKLHLAVDADNG